VRALSNCPALTKVNLPDGCGAIGARAFSGCSGLGRVTLPAEARPDPSAFFRCPAVVSKRTGPSPSLPRLPKRGAAPFLAASLAAVFKAELRAWLPGTQESKLIVRGEGGDAAMVNAFIDAAVGRRRTLVLIETKNGGALCGAFVAGSWRVGWVEPSPGSFLFTLKNHLGEPPTKFPATTGRVTASAFRGECVDFGAIRIGQRAGEPEPLGRHYEDVLGRGAAIFNGDASDEFCAGRWELWETS
jgi:hypothetical protein